MCSARFLTTPIADQECDGILKKYFVNGHRRGYFMVDGFCMPDHYVRAGEQILDFQVRDDDVWVCSFPKTGTTWTQEMVWCIANNLDFEAARSCLANRFPFIDVPGIFYTPQGKPDPAESFFDESILNPIQYLNRIESPRFIKTHLPYNLIPLQLQNRQSKAKMIVVTRNPRDTCVSYYHHCFNVEGYTGNFEDFTKLFLNDAVTYAPFDKNVLSYWKFRDDPRILFLKYEDMKKDLPSVIRTVSEFLGKSYDDEEVGRLADHLSFDNMKKNLSIVRDDDRDTDGYSLLRKGQIGSWKEAMPKETIERFQSWTKERFDGTGLDWEYS